MVLGDDVTKLQRFVWLFNHVSGVITWSLFNLRAPNLVKWPILTWPFIWWCQFIDYYKFETRPSSLCNSDLQESAEMPEKSWLKVSEKEEWWVWFVWVHKSLLKCVLVSICCYCSEVKLNLLSDKRRQLALRFNTTASSFILSWSPSEYWHIVVICSDV